jgi:hypothetical protein
MASGITEASFISAPYFNYEADLYYICDWTQHCTCEAEALWLGVSSYLTGQGFANVDCYYFFDSYMDNPIPLLVDGTEYEIGAMDYYQSRWLLGENHVLEAPPSWYINDSL